MREAPAATSAPARLEKTLPAPRVRPVRLRLSIVASYAALEAEALAWLDAEGVPAKARRLSRQASMRYRHQGFELAVPRSSPPRAQLRRQRRPGPP